MKMNSTKCISVEFRCTKEHDNRTEFELKQNEICFINIGFEIGDIGVMMSTMAEARNFLNKNVLVSFREELLFGDIVQYIDNLTNIQTVITTDRDDSVKLFADMSDDLNSNVYFKDIPVGDGFDGAQVYCTNVDYIMGNRGKFASLTIQDKERRSAKLHIYNVENTLSDLSGKYIVTNLRRKDYAFVAQEARSLNSEPRANGSDVELCAKYLLNAISEDDELKDFVNATNFIDKAKHFNIKEPIDVGFEVVRLARTVDYIMETANVMKGVDTKTLIRGAFARKAYILTDRKDHTLSRGLQAIIAAAPYKFAQHPDMVVLLDPEPQTKCATYDILSAIEALVEIGIKAEKTIDYRRGN